jgi:DNA polymerase III sliding clamp (beta) subunit (PCNA family)
MTEEVQAQTTVETPPSAHLVFPDAVLFSNAIKVARSVKDEAVFHIEDNCFTIRELDLSEVSMIDMTLGLWECRTSTSPIRFLVKLDDLLQLMPRNLVKDEELKLDLEGNVLKVVARTKDGEVEFQMEVEKPDKDKPLPLPRITLNNVFNVDASALVNAVTTPKYMGDRVKITVENSYPPVLVVEVAGDVTKKVSKVQITGYENLNDGDSSSYDLTRLSAFLKALKSLRLPSLKVGFSSKLPMKISASLDHLSLDYYLAPRVED